MNKSIHWQRPARLLLALALAANLTACVELAVGSAVVGGLAASDRRTLGAQTEDQGIMLKGEGRVAKLLGDSAHVNLTSYNRRVLLTGEVKDEAAKAAAEREVQSVEGVQAVINELEIAGVSSLTSRSSDALISTKVRASLINNKELYANSMKTVTERGTVYLMGRVTAREGNLAAEIARGVSGVQKVVKVFEYITEEELKKLLPPPGNDNTSSRRE